MTWLSANMKGTLQSVHLRLLGLLSVVSGVPQGTVFDPLLFLKSMQTLSLKEDYLCYHKIKDSENTIKLQKDMRKSAFCIQQNKGTDQLHSNHAADQGLFSLHR